MLKLLLLSLVFVGSAHAQVAPLFKSMEAQAKGPFGSNVLQGEGARVPVLDEVPANLQFQAAFRNEVARNLAEQEQFYLGNLFTTNYYELMGEFVYGNAYGNHALDHAGLLAKSSKAMVKAEAMVRSWVLEKYYIEAFPSSKLARSFRLRGISGSEYEPVYASHFFNFYLSSLTTDFQFLPAFLLVKTSPIAGSSTLERARVLVAQIYDSMSEKWTSNPNSPRVTRLYSIRNVIHNQLTPAVVGMIDSYIADYPATAEEKYEDLLKVREIIVQYYGINIDKVLEMAQKLGLLQVALASQKIKAEGRTIPNLLALSQAIADVKTNIPLVPAANKTRHLLLLATATQYMSKEMGLLARFDTKEIIEIAVNMIYSEGFLIKDNWQYFISEVKGSQDVFAAATQIPNVLEIATDTLTQSLGDTFSQWKSIEPKMQSFIDNTLKSSSLSVATALAEKIKR